MSVSLPDGNIDNLWGADKEYVITVILQNRELLSDYERVSFLYLSETSSEIPVKFVFNPA